MLPHPTFYVGAGDMNSVPQTYATNTLLMSQVPSPGYLFYTTVLQTYNKKAKASSRTLKRPHFCSLQSILLALNISVHGVVCVYKIIFFLTDMYQATRTAITKYHRLDRLNHRNRFFSSEALKSEQDDIIVFKVVSSRACLSPWLADVHLVPVFSRGLPSVCIFVLATSLYKVIFGLGPMNMSLFCISYLFKGTLTPPTNCILEYWGLGCQHMSWEEGQIQPIRSIFLFCKENTLQPRSLISFVSIRP